MTTGHAQAIAFVAEVAASWCGPLRPQNGEPLGILRASLIWGVAHVTLTGGFATQQECWDGFQNIIEQCYGKTDGGSFDFNDNGKAATLDEQNPKSLLTFNHYVCLYPELYRSAPGKAAIYELPEYLDVALKGLDVAALSVRHVGCTYATRATPILNIMSNALQQLVPVLDGSNYTRWAELMKAYLQQQEVWYIVELPDGITAPTLAEDGSNRNEVIAWTTTQSKAMGSIRLRLNDEVAKLVKDATTAKELWDDLKEFYGTTSALGAYSYYKAAVGTRIPLNEHPGPAIAKIQGNLDQLEGAGINIPANLRALMILDAAPSRYETAIQLCLNDNDLSELTTSAAREALVASWEATTTRGNRNKAGEAKKLSAIKRKGKDPSFKQQQQQRHQNGDGSSQQQQQKKGKARRGKRKSQKSSDHDHAHLVSPATISDGPTSTVDPRALLRKPVQVNGPEGESKYPTLKRAFNLARELDVTPSIERIRALEGVIKAADKGEGTSRIVEVPSDSDSADSHSSKRTRLTLAERIDWTERDDDAESAISLGNEDEDVDMEIAQAAGLYEQYDEQVRPFELIHSDLKSFPVDSYHKYKYAIMFLDDHTSYAWAVCLRSKDAALTATKHFLANVENQFKTKVQKWMSDGGGEYKSKAFDNLLKDKGIEILQSVPHQPQQNGRAERLMRTLSDKAEAMRLEACLPQSWWEFAIEHAVHVYNRTPLRRHKWRTPYEVLNGEAPSIRHLRVFGCGAYVHLPPAVRPNKLSPKSELMVYIGVAPGGHGFRFMRSPNNVIFTSAYALFDETMFPKCPTNQRRRTSRLEDEPEENPSDQESSIPSGNDDDDEDQLPRHPPQNLPERRQEQEHDDAPEAPPRTPSPPPRVPEVPPTPKKKVPARVRKVPIRPGNIYGESRHPVEQFKEIEKQGEWEKLVGQKPGRSRATGPSRSEQVPGNSSAPSPPSDIPAPSASGDAPGGESSGNSSDEVDNALRAAAGDEIAMAQLCREGGVALINFLLMKAVPPVDDLPDTSNVREWTYRDITCLPEAEQREWKAACQEELEALRRRKVFELVDRPKGRKVIKNRWVFDVKSDGRKKARLVAKGFSQVEGIDYDQIFSPVVRFETVRLILALAALENWYITGLDVRNAYLYGKLDEEIYMEQPEGFVAKGQERKVLRLLRALYGLKQAGRAWWSTLNQSMKELGFSRLVSDPGLFICKDKNGQLVIVVVYVDDALFCGPDKALVEKMKAKFMKKWECRDLGEVKEFLRMRIQRSGSTIRIDQCAYLEKVLQRCGMQNAKSVPTPLPAGYYPKPNDGTADSTLRSRFQTVIGSLLYIMLGTRPDIAFAVTKLSQFAANPSQEHLNKVLYICRYLIGTRSYALVYKDASGLSISACTDSDWGSDPSSRQSQTGYFLKLAGGTFSWQSRAQKTVAHSSTEAEYMAMSDCSRQVVWIRNLMGEIGYKLGPIPIAGDNQGSLFMGSNPVTESRSKHIDIKYHAIREYIENKLIEVFYVDTDNNPADLFTKNLGRVKFTEFRGELGLEFYDSA
ncbi:hypothetical protein ACG7TL_002116 [Trametes sanguinea]